MTTPSETTPRERGTRDSEARQQVAALPYRLRDGALNVLLVTSRETRRWVLPKGWPMRGRKPHQAAAREAWEEAGAVGRAAKRPVGAYAYRKRLSDGAAVPCVVTVFPLAVERLAERWPEQGERARRWVSPEEAAALVEEEDLAALLRAFGGAGPVLSSGVA